MEEGLLDAHCKDLISGLYLSQWAVLSRAQTMRRLRYRGLGTIWPLTLRAVNNMYFLVAFKVKLFARDAMAATAPRSHRTN